MQKHALFLLLLSGVAFANHTKNEVTADCTSTPQTHTLDGDKYVYLNCQNRTEWKNTDMTIEGGKDTGGLTLDIASIAVKDPKSFEIYAINGNNTPILIYSGLPGRKTVLPTGQTKIQIKITNDNGNTVSLKVVQKCDTTFSDSTFTSPIPLTVSPPTSTIVTCTYKFTSPGAIEFTNFVLSENSSAKFTGTADDSLAGPFKDKGPEHVIIIKKSSIFTLELDVKDLKRNVTFNHFVLSDDSICGTDVMRSIEKPLPISVKSADQKKSVSCLWLLVAPENEKLSLTVQPDLNLQHVNDLVSVVDGGNSSGSPLLQLTALNKKLQPVISSQRYLLVSLSSDDLDKNEKFSFTVSPISSGGRLSGKGSMLFQQSSNYLLSTSDDESLIVSFPILKKLEKRQKIVVRVGSEELVTFDSSQKLMNLASPGSTMEIIATGFPVAGVSVDFMSVPKGSGCSRTFTAAQENSARLIGECAGHCSWIVKPIEAANVTELYLQISPNNVPSGMITHLRDNIGAVSLAYSAEPFVISYLASDGASIDFDCSNAKDFEMSYVTKSKSQDLVLNAPTGSNITLSSPFSPGIYPIGGVFTYNVNLPDENIGYLASFKKMDLAEPHTLTIGKTASTFTFRGSDLPGDVIIPASSLKNIVFNATSSSPIENPQGRYGYQIALTPTSDSSTKTDGSSGTITTGDKCAKLRCVYIINLDLPKGLNDSVSMNLTVTLPANLTLNASDLLVWDGESTLRSPLLAPVENLTRGGLFASRSHKLIIVYKSNVNVTFSYVSSPCSFEKNTMCLKERMCMPLSWRCDGIPRCSDGSDEYGCKNGIPPTPQPEPAPSSSSGWKVAFWLFMPLFILLGVGLSKGYPIILQKFRDSRYHQFHDLGDH